MAVRSDPNSPRVSGAACSRTNRADASAIAQVSTAGGCSSTVSERRATVTGCGAEQPRSSLRGSCSSNVTSSVFNRARHCASSAGISVRAVAGGSAGGGSAVGGFSSGASMVDGSSPTSAANDGACKTRHASSNGIGRDLRARIIMLTWAAGEAAATAAAFNYRNGSLQGSGTDRLEPFFEPVAEHRHAHKVFRRTPPGAALPGLSDCGLPFGDVEIAAAYPGDRDQFGGLVDI